MKNWSLNAKIGFVIAVLSIGATTIAYFGISRMAMINDMMSELAKLQERWRMEGNNYPPIDIGVGINSGPMVVGNMGGDQRFGYTVLGDNVNLAARMESGAKGWGAYAMCTDATRRECEKHSGDRVVFRALGRILVMGRSQPVPIFELVGLKEHVTDPTREGIAVFERGLARYHDRDWTGAIAEFRRSALLEPNLPGQTPGVKDNPSLVYIKICERFQIEPPALGWDGVYKMSEK